MKLVGVPKAPNLQRAAARPRRLRPAIACWALRAGADAEEIRAGLSSAGQGLSPGPLRQRRAARRGAATISPPWPGASTPPTPPSTRRREKKAPAPSRSSRSQPVPPDSRHRARRPFTRPRPLAAARRVLPAGARVWRCCSPCRRARPAARRCADRATDCVPAALRWRSWPRRARPVAPSSWRGGHRRSAADGPAPPGPAPPGSLAQGVERLQDGVAHQVALLRIGDVGFLRGSSVCRARRMSCSGAYG